jgi:alpha-galactosidase/6-phospho-beta-glucosidase family protein
MTDLTVKGISDPYAQLTMENYFKYEIEHDPDFKTGTTDDEVKKLMKTNETFRPHYFNFYLYEQLGYFPLAGGGHICENLPFFCNSLDTMKKFHLHRKGVLPGRADRKAERVDRLKEILKNGSVPEEIEQRSNEMLCDAIVGLCAGEPRRIIAALPNEGQIDNLDRDIAVETWATATLSGVDPVTSGNMPLPLKGFMEQIIVEQELSVEAALTGEKKNFVQALINSPQLHCKDRAEELADELLAANKEWLPQFR